MNTRTAIVVATAQHAGRLQRDLDPERKRFLFIYPEYRVGGLKFNAVIVSDEFHRYAHFSSTSRAEFMHRWLEEDVAMRLDKDARMVRL